MIAASPKQIAGCSNLSYLQSGCLTGVNTARNRQEPHFSTKSNSEINYELNTSLSISSQPAVPCRTELQQLGLTRTSEQDRVKASITLELSYTSEAGFEADVFKAH